MDGQDAKAVGSERTLKLENVCCCHILPSEPRMDDR